MSTTAAIVRLWVLAAGVRWGHFGGDAPKSISPAEMSPHSRGPREMGRLGTIVPGMSPRSPMGVASISRLPTARGDICETVVGHSGRRILGDISRKWDIFYLSQSEGCSA